jgi:hypothetical protein
MLLTRNAEGPAAFITFLLANASSLAWYRGYLASTRRQATLLWLAALAISGAVFAWHVNGDRRLPHFGNNEMSQEIDAVAALAGAACLSFFAVPFVAKMYFKWVGGLVTEQEKTPGADGVRAWLKAGNLICALLLSLCASFGYGYSFWGIFAVCVAALLAYPAVRFAFQSAPAAEVPKEAPSPEREKIVKLAAEGKITAEESTALLNALAPAAKSRTSGASSVTSAQKLVLLGAALVLIGFFLPWFSFNPGQEMNRQFQNVIGNLAQQIPDVNFHSDVQLPAGLKTGSFTTNGGDIPRGLGWLVLCLAVAAAALPHFAGEMDAHKRRLATFACLGAGAVITVYLMTQSFRFASAGIVLVLGGYALELLGTLKEQQTAAI